MFSKIFIISFIHKLTTGTQSLVLFIWDVAPVVYLFGRCATGGLAFDFQLFQFCLIFQILCNVLTMTNQALFHHKLKVNQDISKIS